MYNNISCIDPPFELRMIKDEGGSKNLNQKSKHNSKAQQVYQKNS